MRTVDIVYGVDQELEELLRSIDRPGDFCAHGRLLAPMPKVEVDGAGLLSFPVPEAQVRALIEVAERAPYGRGPDTLVDTSIRDCWQIHPARIRLSGKGWPDTFANILDSAAEGLGCPSGRLDAQLYKLLVYETGGFFSPHRDTEKVDGMIATLSISLPVKGGGGELFVRHGDREVGMDMGAEEPSELAFAAFYADCAHEIQPVVEGHRLSLVFNLCLRADDSGTPREAPDYTEEIDAIASRLVEWHHAEDACEKRVWLLDHEYSEAGLSFDTLKNADAALAQSLGRAAELADCELHAAIVHIEEHGDALFDGEHVHRWRRSRSGADDMEIGYLYDSRHWLDGWVGRDGSQPPFGEIELLPGELLPRGALDDAEPDKQWLHEASGNEGVSLERAYRRAAFVVWPRQRTLAIVAGGGIDRAVAWVASELDRNSGWSASSVLSGPEDQNLANHAGATNERIAQLLSELIDLWPSGAGDRSEQPARTRMLALLSASGDEVGAARFLREVLLKRYNGSENQDLAPVLDRIGPDSAKHFLLNLVGSRFARRPVEMVGLVRVLHEKRGGPASASWEDTLRHCVRAILLAVPAALSRASTEAIDQPATNVWREPNSLSPNPIDHRTIRDVFALAWRWGLTDEADVAAQAVANHPDAVSPDRVLPAALRDLSREDGLADTTAFVTLWRHATEFLLARSCRLPEEPRDWVITAEIDCDCELCGRLRAFCRDPEATTARYPLRKELRAHLHQLIDRHGLDIDHVTERRGRPFTLVCTKNRASHRRRLTEYSEDVNCMRTLIHAPPSGERSETLMSVLTQLRVAVADSG